MDFLDVRLAKTYADSRDPHFIADTLEAYLLNPYAEDAIEDIEEHLTRHADLRDIPSLEAMDVRPKLCHELAQRLGPNGTTPFAYTSGVSKVLKCDCNSEGEPIFCNELLQKAIFDKLDQEYTKLGEKKEELQKDPAVLALVALNDARGLEGYLKSKKEERELTYASEARNIGVSSRRSSPGFGLFRRFRSQSQNTDDNQSQSRNPASANNARTTHPLLEVDDRRNTGLILAARLGHVECVKVILQHASQERNNVLRKLLRAQDETGRTAIYYAITRDFRNLEILQLLVEAGDSGLQAATIEDYGVWYSGLEMVVKKACKRHDMGYKMLKKCIELLGDNLEINKKYDGRRPKPHNDAGGESAGDAPVHRSAGDVDDDEDDDDESMVSDMEGMFEDDELEREFRGFMRRMRPYLGGEEYGGSREYVLVDKAAQYGSPDVVKLLLEIGAHPSETVLHHILDRMERSYLADDGDLSSLDLPQLGYFVCMKELIAASPAIVNARKGSGDTPLHIAAERGIFVAVKLLVEHKANVNARNESNDTPAMVAEKEGYNDIAEYLNSRRMLSRLLTTTFSRRYRDQNTELEAVAEEDMCVICTVRPKQVILAPCGHKMACKSCTRKLLEGGTDMRKCPMCSEYIESCVVKVFE